MNTTYYILGRDKDNEDKSFTIRMMHGSYMGRELNNIPLMFNNPEDAVKVAGYREEVFEVTLNVRSRWEPR
jgi:hypothetical protein